MDTEKGNRTCKYQRFSGYFTVARRSIVSPYWLLLGKLASIIASNIQLSNANKMGKRGYER